MYIKGKNFSYLFIPVRLTNLQVIFILTMYIKIVFYRVRESGEMLNLYMQFTLKVEPDIHQRQNKKRTLMVFPKFVSPSPSTRYNFHKSVLGKYRTLHREHSEKDI